MSLISSFTAFVFTVSAFTVSPVSMLVLPFLIPSGTAHAQAQMVSAAEREAFHRDPQWQLIAPHLPDPATATAEQLESTADVLRARRFPQDALDYYGYAIARGATLSPVLNKMGVLRLELRQGDIAHELFLRTVKADKKNASAWNNLGVTEYLRKQFKAAIRDYRKASKLDPNSAVYHSNIGMACFENADMEGARKEFAIALKLDPHMGEHGSGGGATAQVVGTQNYGRLAMEMAKVYAKNHNDEATILWLAKATEAGYDTRSEMGLCSELRPYMKDARVLVMIKNAQLMKAHPGNSSTVRTASLGPAEPHVP